MHPMLTIGVRAARKAGQFIIQAYEQDKQLKSSYKNHQELRIKIKKLAAEMMASIINKAYPTHTVLTDLSEISSEIKTETQWLLMPLQGYVNFAKKLPYFALSLCVIVRGQTEVAIVYDMIQNEIFTAIRGSGVQLNGYRLRCVPCVLNHRYVPRILAINTVKNITTSFEKITTLLSKLRQEHYDFRRSGCVVLDLAYVAANRIDGFLGIGLSPYSCIAGKLLVQEAGGLVDEVNELYSNFCVDNILLAAPEKILKDLSMHCSQMSLL